MDKRPFDTLCTLLRPGGAHSAGWDVLDEAETTFQDFNWLSAASLINIIYHSRFNLCTAERKRMIPGT